MTTPPHKITKVLLFSDPSLANDCRTWFAGFPCYLPPDSLLQTVNEDWN
jgi:hypothetical protein